MAFERRLINGRSSNAGLVALTGAAGRGFADAGKSIANLGLNISKNDRQDKMLEDARTEAYKNRDATASYNATVNPEVAKTMTKEQLGRVKLTAPIAKDGYTLKEGEARYNANGTQIVKLDKAAPKSKTSKTVTDANDMIHVVMNDGTTKPTNLKSKDYWKKGKGSGSSKKNDIPENYVFAGEFDINDELDYELATSGAYYTDKSGKRYVNQTKYNRLINLGNTEIK